jgi:hypothetical protein
MCKQVVRVKHERARERAAKLQRGREGAGNGFGSARSSRTQGGNGRVCGRRGCIAAVAAAAAAAQHCVRLTCAMGAPRRASRSRLSASMPVPGRTASATASCGGRPDTVTVMRDIGATA